MEKLKSISKQDILIYSTIVFSAILILLGVLFGYTDGLVAGIDGTKITYAHDLQSSGSDDDLYITMSAFLFGATLFIALINLVLNKFIKKEFVFSFYFFILIWLFQLIFVYALDVPPIETIRHGNIIFITWLLALAISGPALIINRVILKKI